MNYMYIGNISGHSTNPNEPDTLTVFLYDPDEAKKPPVMLTAHGTLSRLSRRAVTSPNLLINFITRRAGWDASHPAQQRR